MLYRTLILLFFFTLILFAESKTSLLTAIARDTIVGDLTGVKSVDKSTLQGQYPFLAEPGATFVTLNKSKRLRGCIGSLKSYRPLIDDMVSNAKSAAFSDPRFRALEKSELSSLAVEVSVLTPPQRVTYANHSDLKRQIEVGEDGIVLESHSHRATFLPQVWDELPTFELFFETLCEKADLNKNCLNHHPLIYTYHVEKYSEVDLTYRPTPNAGLFYPQSCTSLKKQFHTFEKQARLEKRTTKVQSPRALIVPHAGYIYSGYTASLAYQKVLESRARRVILIGPSHHHYFKGVAATEYEAFTTPCGLLRSDESYLAQLKSKFSLQDADQKLSKEHSTEVQLPFINYYLPQMKVVELIYGDVSLEKLTEMMTYLLKDPNNLLVVSSDLSHYYSKKEAQKHDFICLDGVEKLSTHRLQEGCEACGKRGVEALVQASKRLNFKSKLLDYRTSASYLGDEKKVVGYMSVVITD